MDFFFFFAKRTNKKSKGNSTEKETKQQQQQQQRRRLWKTWQWKNSVECKTKPNPKWRLKKKKKGNSLNTEVTVHFVIGYKRLSFFPLLFFNFHLLTQLLYLWQRQSSNPSPNVTAICCSQVTALTVIVTYVMETCWGWGVGMHFHGKQG